MTHLVDTSVWHKYGRYAAVAEAVNELDVAGAIFSTCPPVIAEYCFSAKNIFELKSMADEMAQFYRLDSIALTEPVHHIQQALTKQGLHRAVGASDTVIAAYAIAAEQVLVTCDSDFLHIAHALKKSRSLGRLHVVHIAETGLVTQV